MKHRSSTAISIAALILLGCSTPPPRPEPALVAVPPPEIQRDLPPEQREMLAGRICTLGTSCLELDKRPFEACLVGTKHCVDKALETQQVETLKPPADSRPLETAGRSPATSPAPDPAR